MSWFGIDAEDDEPPMTNAMIPPETGVPPSLGNSDMMNIPKNNSALRIMNDPAVKEEFGLASAPIPPPKSKLSRAVPHMRNKLPKLNGSIGDIRWSTGETWAVLAGGVALGFVAAKVWDRTTR